MPVDVMAAYLTLLQRRQAATYGDKVVPDAFDICYKEIHDATSLRCVGSLPGLI